MGVEHSPPKPSEPDSETAADANAAANLAEERAAALVALEALEELTAAVGDAKGLAEARKLQAELYPQLFDAFYKSSRHWSGELGVRADIVRRSYFNKGYAINQCLVTERQLNAQLVSLEVPFDLEYERLKKLPGTLVKPDKIKTDGSEFRDRHTVIEWPSGVLSAHTNQRRIGNKAVGLPEDPQFFGHYED